MEQCRFCQSVNLEKVWENEYDIPMEIGVRKVIVTISICKDCGLIFQSPQISDEDMDFLYKYQYRFDINRDTAYLSRKQQYDFTIENYKVNHGRILDIGCGEAYFLSFFDAGFERHGVEPSETSVRRAKENYPQINVRKGFYEGIEYPAEHFDIITIRHVLEHVKDPMSVLDKIRKELKHDGILYIEVPNVNMSVNLEDITDFFGYQHTFHFSPITLENILVKAGFEMQVMCENLEYPAMRVIARKSQKQANIVRNDYFNFALNFKKSLENKMYIRNKIKRKLNNLNDNWKQENKRIFIYGSGMHTEELIKIINPGDFNIHGLIDKSTYKQGKNIFGYKVYSPESIDGLEADVIIISSYAFQEEIYSDLINKYRHEKDIIKLYDAIEMKPYLS